MVDSLVLPDAVLLAAVLVLGAKPLTIGVRMLCVQYSYMLEPVVSYESLGK